MHRPGLSLPFAEQWFAAASPTAHTSDRRSFVIQPNKQTRDRLLGLLLCYITLLLVLGALTSLAGWPQSTKELVRGRSPTPLKLVVLKHHAPAVTLPCPSMPLHAPAMLCHAVPCQASAMSWRAVPCHALPCHAVPCPRPAPALPCHATQASTNAAILSCASCGASRRMRAASFTTPAPWPQS